MTATLVESAPQRTGLGGILEKPLLFVGGKGGVGKTTLAAAIALAIAIRYPERKVLLLSTDPAHSLSDALGETLTWPAPLHNLRLLELKAERVFAEFRERHQEGLRKIALRGTLLDEADLRPFLEAGLPGLDELAALKVIAETVKTGNADHLIVDTAPTGHTLRLLALPDIIRQWREALDSLMAKHRLMAALYAKRYTPDEADAVIDELRDIHALFRGTVSNAERTAFVVVMNPDPLSLWETRRLVEALGKLGVTVPCVVVNKILPGGSSCGVCARLHDRQAEWRDKARAELRCRVFEIPCWPVEPRGSQALAALGEMLYAGALPLYTGPAAAPTHSGAAAEPARPDGMARALHKASVLLVCGKGGVGKTTVASALALHLASRRVGARVLLFSTDPAHSLSDAFGTQFGSEPTSVAKGLDAIEVDPASRLEQLRETYRQEMAGFFGSLFRSDLLDSPLDREAMERLIDLSPPGLDEIMALAQLSRYIPGNEYDTFVIDTPPTGHFLRFLELPELMRAWLRAFFGIFLKYKALSRMPKIRALLVNLSKDIKEFQGVLATPDKALVLPVAVPTALAFEQTRDLLGRAKQLGMTARVGVLNHVTLQSAGCADCAGRADVSRQFLMRYREAFSGIHFLRLEEQMQNITGIGQLNRIGDTLFG